MRERVEISIPSGLDTGLSHKSRLHHAVWEIGKGATAFYADNPESRQFAVQEAKELEATDGNSRTVMLIEEGDSYDSYNPRTDITTIAIHGQDGYHNNSSV